MLELRRSAELPPDVRDLTVDLVVHLRVTDRDPRLRRVEDEENLIHFLLESLREEFSEQHRVLGNLKALGLQSKDKILQLVEGDRRVAHYRYDAVEKLPWILSLRRSIVGPRETHGCRGKPDRRPDRQKASLRIMRHQPGSPTGAFGRPTASPPRISTNRWITAGNRSG